MMLPTMVVMSVFMKMTMELGLKIGSDIDGEYNSVFSGSAVSLSADGSVVAIGAIYNDGNGYNSGHVRIYENMTME